MISKTSKNNDEQDSFKNITISLIPHSSFSRLPSADSLFGKFCWSIVDLYGENKLEKMLSIHLEKPVLLFSSIFPKDTTPKPIGPFLENNNSDEEDYTRKKEIEKTAYLPVKDVRKYIEGKIIKINNNIFSLKEEVSVHTAISRNTFTVIEGQLFTLNEKWSETKLWFFVRYREQIFEELSINLEYTFDYLFKTGIGQKKSSGKGIYEISSITNNFLLSEDSESNAFISLSKWMPSINDPCKGWYSLKPKIGKLGGNFAHLGISNKRPLLLIEEGSTFFTDLKKPYFGKIATNMSTDKRIKKNIIQNTLCFPYYLKIPNGDLIEQ